MPQQGAYRLDDAKPIGQFSLADVETPAPDFKTANEKDAQGNAVVSLWDKANTPLVPQIADAAKAIGAYLNQPVNADDTLLNHIHAQLKGFREGAITGAGQMLAGFTSPVGLALTVAQLGPESAALKQVPGLASVLKLPAVQALQKAVSVGAGLGFAAQGAGDVASGLGAGDYGQVARGVAEGASGLAGVAGAAGGGTIPKVFNGWTNPAEAAAVEAGQNAGVPVGLATATGNKGLVGLQYMADRSLGGAQIAGRAAQASDEALGTWGSRLAADAHPVAQTPETVGAAARAALEAKAAAHNIAADRQYEFIRQQEQQPENRMLIPGSVTPGPIDTAPSWEAPQLRRIVHELDANGYRSHDWMDQTQERGVNAGNAAGGQYTVIAGNAGAPVYNDVLDAIGSANKPTRLQLQDEIEAYLAGGPKTKAVEAARQVAFDRMKGTPGLSPPGPADLMQVPTSLEAGRQTSQDMGFPTNLAPIKPLMRQYYDAVTRLMPVAQRENSPGILALEGIIDAPDWMPLSEADQNLSAIKALARKNPGLSQLAVKALESAVSEAATNAGPEVKQALAEGRRQIIQRVGTQDVLDALPGGKLEEPVAVFARATAPNDAGIEFLRALRSQVPSEIPKLARAQLDELTAQTPKKAWAEWQNLGDSTKSVLYPDAAHVQALDQFFRLRNLIDTTSNYNTSNSAAAIAAGQAMSTVMHPSQMLEQVGIQLGASGLSALLHSPAVTKALMSAVKLHPTAPAVARAAAWAQVVSAAKAAKVPVPLVPALADTSEPNK